MAGFGRFEWTWGRLGGRSASFVDGNFSDLEYSISGCKDWICETCPKRSSQKFFHSIVYSKDRIFNPPRSKSNCKSSNLIYVITCENCGVQYLGEKQWWHWISVWTSITLLKMDVSTLYYTLKNFKLVKLIFYSSDGNFGWSWVWWIHGIR